MRVRGRIVSGVFARAGISFRGAVATFFCIVISFSAAAAPVKVGRALVTFYWVVDERSAEYRGAASAVLRDSAGHVLARTHPRFRRDLIRQGSGWLRDGRTIIYMRKLRGQARFRISRARYGLGSTGCRLVPYRTIAVDPRFVRLGTKISIPQLKGARLPDGTIHDGMFIAADRGQFRGAHIDLFVGAGSGAARPFIRRGYGSRSHVTVYTNGRTSRCR
jgi:3D (Asp-Asp-Asp) domain-containing protein